jgi:hypothetical protein
VKAILKSLFQKSKIALIQMKVIITDPLGWIAWFLANLVVSAFWYVPFGIGLLFGIDWLYQFGITMFIAMWMPPPIESIFVAFLTIFFYKLLKLKNKSKKGGKENH